MTRYIAITGTHSTGKSTFVEELRSLAERFGLRVGTIEDKAKSCQDNGFGILKQHTFESTLWIMSTVIRAEQKSSLTADLVIVDRPVSDAIGYLESAFAATDRSIPEKDLAYLYGLAKLHTSRYDLLYKTVLDESIPLGEGRDRDLAFRRDVDQRIGASLSTLGVVPLDPQTENGKAQAIALIEGISRGVAELV